MSETGSFRSSDAEQADAGGASRPGTPSAVADPAVWRSPLLARAFLVAGVVAVALAATFLRQTGVARQDTIWAEDGSVFAACAYSQPVMDCLASPFAGWIHVVPRLAAEVAVLGDTIDLSLRLALIGGLLAAAAAAIVALAILDVTGNPLSGLIAGTGLVLVWSAVDEVTGSITNLHWILLTASIVVIACTWLGRAPGVVGLALLALTVLSSPFAPLLLTLLAILAVLLGSPGAKLMTVVVIAAAAPQLLAIATSSRADYPLPERSVMDLVAYVDLGIRRTGVFGYGHTVANTALVMFAVMLVVALAAQRRSREVLAVSMLLICGLLVLLVSLVLNQHYAVRYGYALAALTVAAVALGVGLLTARMKPPLRRASVLAVALVLAVGVVGTFRQQTPSSIGPDVKAQIRAADCSRGVDTRVIVSPLIAGEPPFSLHVPCP